jgi:hypothetical protein
VAREGAADAGGGPENASRADDWDGPLLPAQPSEQGQGQVPEVVRGFRTQKPGHGVALTSGLHDHGKQCGDLSLRQVLCHHLGNLPETQGMADALRQLRMRAAPVKIAQCGGNRLSP